MALVELKEIKTSRRKSSISQPPSCTERKVPGVSRNPKPPEPEECDRSILAELLK